MADVDHDPLADEVLAAYRRVHDPGPDATAAALARVKARIDEGAPVPELDAPPPVLPKVALVALALAAAVILALQLDLGGVAHEDDAARGDDHSAVYAGERDSDGGSAQARASTSKAAPREASPTPPPPEPVEPPPVEPGAPAGDALEPDPIRAPAPAVRTPVKRRPAPTPAPNPTDATAHAELSLLRGAQSALAAGNPARALQQLDRHASSFPDSLLAEEREVARIRALCDLGRTTQAHAAQKKFLQAFAGSPLAGQAAKACDDTGSEDGP